MPGFLADLPCTIDMIKDAIGTAVTVVLHSVLDSNDPSLNDRRSDDMKYEDIKGYYDDLYIARKALRASDFELKSYPGFSDAICMAQRSRSFILTPEGGIRKCIREVSGRGAQITDGVPNERAKFYNEVDAETSPVCLQCQYLPICHSGCPKDLHERPEDILRRCTPWKFLLQRELSDKLERLTRLSTGGV